MNEYTQPISLDVYTSPTSDVQSFVNGLIDAYDRRSLKARVVRLERERVAEPVFDLDDTDPSVTEDDLLSARIFPRTESEKEQEILLSEIDTAVEACADSIIQHARTSYAYSQRALLVVYAVSRTVYRRATEYLAAFVEGVSSRALPVPIPVETSTDARISSISEISEHYIPSYSTPTLETLTYAYNVVPSPLTLEENSSDSVLPAYNQARISHMGDAGSYGAPTEHGDEPFSWALVAECLYTQFRYGSASQNRQ